MQDYELDAYLDGADASDEQRAAMHAVWDALHARYWDDEDGLDPDCHEAFAMAVAVILDDETPEALARRWQQAKVAERQAMASLTGALVAAHELGRTELELSRTLEMNRMTVRKALGK